MKCSICGKPMNEEDQGHNAEPVNHGLGCTVCNVGVVLNARMDKIKSLIIVPKFTDVFTKKGTIN